MVWFSAGQKKASKLIEAFYMLLQDSFFLLVTNELMLCFLEFFNSCGQLRKYLLRITHYSIIRRLKERRFRIFIDHYYSLGTIHSGKVLYSARNAYCHI